MHKNDVCSSVSSEEEFPSKGLVEAVFRARGDLRKFVPLCDIQAVKTELCLAAVNVTREMSRFATEPLLLSEGNFPTMMFATNLIKAFHLSRSEDSILNQFTQELKQSIAKRSDPLFLKNGYELACDSRGELILRPKQTSPHLRVVPVSPATAVA